MERSTGGLGCKRASGPTGLGIGKEDILVGFGTLTARSRTPPKMIRIEVDLVGGITCVAYGIVIPCCFAVLFAKQHVIMQPLGRSSLSRRRPFQYVRGP